MHEDVRFKHDEGRFTRFFIFLNLFIAAMMILVSGDSYMMLFVGWEGVGLCSFLLIGFWYEMDTLGRPSWANSDAAKKAFIVNRIGDFGFLIAGFLMFWYLGSFQFDAGLQSRARSCGVRSVGDRGDYLVHADRCCGQVRADSALRLAARCDGGSNTCLGVDPCRDDGDSGCVSRHAFRSALYPCA